MMIMYMIQLDEVGECNNYKRQSDDSRVFRIHEEGAEGEQQENSATNLEKKSQDFNPCCGSRSAGIRMICQIRLHTEPMRIFHEPKIKKFFSQNGKLFMSLVFPVFC